MIMQIKYLQNMQMFAISNLILVYHGQVSLWFVILTWQAVSFILNIIVEGIRRSYTIDDHTPYDYATIMASIKHAQQEDSSNVHSASLPYFSYIASLSNVT